MPRKGHKINALMRMCPIPLHFFGSSHVAKHHFLPAAFEALTAEDVNFQKFAKALFHPVSGGKMTQALVDEIIHLIKMLGGPLCIVILYCKSQKHLHGQIDLVRLTWSD